MTVVTHNCVNPNYDHMYFVSGRAYPMPLSVFIRRRLPLQFPQAYAFKGKQQTVKTDMISFQVRAEFRENWIWESFNEYDGYLIGLDHLLTIRNSNGPKFVILNIKVKVKLFSFHFMIRKFTNGPKFVILTKK